MKGIRYESLPKVGHKEYLSPTSTGGRATYSTYTEPHVEMEQLGGNLGA